MRNFKLALHWQILIAIVLAIFIALTFPNVPKYTNWLGDVFISILKMLIIPIIFTSITSSITKLGQQQKIGKIALKTFSLYIITTLLAIITGLFLVNIIKPGVGVNFGSTISTENLNITKINLTELLKKLIPTDGLSAFLQGDIFQVILISFLLGFFTIKIPPENSQFLKNLFQSLYEVTMKITEFFIKFAPLGIFGIMTKIVSDNQNLFNLLKSIGLYVLVVLLGLLIHMFVSMFIILAIYKINPFKHFKNMLTVLLTAFSTSSSSATLPITLETIKTNSKVSDKIASFTLPLGATINMNGTALYELVVTFFIAQVYGVELTFFQQLIVVLSALLVAIGAAGIPMAGMVMISIILTAVGLPVEGIGIILAVDRFLDMFRTAVNVWGDTCCTVIIAKTEGENIAY